MTEKEEPSGCAGVAVVVVVGLGILAGVWAAAPNFSLLAGWAIGTGAVWWAVSRPLPSPVKEPLIEEETADQPLIYEDKQGHHTVEWGEE